MQPITSDIPEATNNPIQNEWVQDRKTAHQNESYHAAVCGNCGDILQFTITNGAVCRSHCKTTADPIIREYRYLSQPAPYIDFCISDDDHGDNMVFRPMKAAQTIKENYLFLTDRSTKILYVYDPEIHRWSSDGETYLHELVATSMDTEYKPNHYVNVLDSLKSITYTEITFSHKIAVENGLLDVTTGELTEFSPNEMPFYSIPVTYDPSATCTLFETFISQVVDKDDIPLCQEWAGYCLNPSYPKHKFLFAYGKGRNGKGVYDRTIKGILGAHNCLNLRLEELNGDNRFTLARLHGKLYVSCSEPQTNRELQTPILKTITGGDMIDAEIKNKQDTNQFINAGKITIYGQQFPRVNDKSDGFYDRVEILEFPNHIPEADRIDNLENSWLNNPKERSAVFNWMLQGLQRLQRQGHFTTSKTQQEKILELKKVSDPFAAFIEEKTEIIPRSEISRADLYSAFIDYCEEIGTKPLNNTIFTQNMKKQPKVKGKMGRVQGTLTRVWEGITLKTAKTDTLDTLDTALSAFNISKNPKKEEGERGVSSVSSVSNPPRKRFCSTECINFHTAKCPASNPENRDKYAEIPLGCSGYNYPNMEEF